MPALSPDLVYYCGDSLPWDPRSKDLGGSEQAVVELSRHWAQTGLKVEVYASIPERMLCDGVTYWPVQDAPEILHADAVVLWRLYGLVGFWKGQHRFRCRRLAVDFHDRELFGREELLYKSRNHLQALMFKSQFHTNFLLNKLPAEKQAALRDRAKVIPNGIRKQDFTLIDPPAREPHRFCYASCYLRGLVPLIDYFWPAVRQLWPDAELHVYYGMEHVRDAAARETISQALQSEGVHDHGRQPVSVISEEKHRSSFHLYYTNSVIETDCISIKESAVAGCIPIISDANVFAERSGIVMPGAAASAQDFRQAGQAFVSWVQQISEPDLETIRQSLREVNTHRDWQETATQWAQELELVAPMISWDQMTQISDKLFQDSQTTQGKGSSRQPSRGRRKRTLKAIQYINMPGKTERETSLRKQLLQSCPVELIERFEAIVGETHQFSQDELKLFEGCRFADSIFAKGIMGNALSHMAIWKSTSQLDDDDIVVVLQDDALLIKDFMNQLHEVIASMPDDAPLILLSDHEAAHCDTFVPVDLESQSLEARSQFMTEIVTAKVGKRKNDWTTHCCLAYLLTPQGARELLEYTDRVGFKTESDHHLNGFLLEQDKNYASILCLATSSSKLFTSDVWDVAKFLR